MDLDRLVRALGDFKFPVTSIPYAPTYGAGSLTAMSLRNFVGLFEASDSALVRGRSDGMARHPLYIFDDSFSHRIPDALEHLAPTPRAFTAIAAACQLRHQLALGPRMTGAHIHFHQDAWNLLLAGEKRWFLQPPGNKTVSRKHPVDWLEDDYTAATAAGALLECTQRPGDVLFIPHHWSHAVVNVRDSLAVATEFRMC